jgi:hypothetical protein
MSLLRMGDWIDAFRPADQAPAATAGRVFPLEPVGLWGACGWRRCCRRWPA